jgi:large conductance mechanosensitive channel
MRTLLQDFEAFLLRGNLLELAVAFVLGLAFAAVITSLVNDVIMQIVAAIAGKPDFSTLSFHLGSGVIRYGAFLTALVTFLLVAAVLYLIVRGVGRLIPPKAAMRDCPNCVSSIPIGAFVCPFCTRDVSPVAAA